MIDTLKVSRTLEGAGFAKAQADVVAATFAEVFSDAHEELVIKDYFRAQLGEFRTEIAALRSDSRTEMAALKSDLRAEIASLKSDLGSELAKSKGDLRAEIANSKIEVIRWMIGLQVTLIVALVALANFTKLL